MIIESVVCVILRCSRCNTPFTDEDERPINWAPEDLADAFPANPDPSDDDVWPAMRDWHQFGDRVVCPECVYLDDDGVLYENPNPLRAAEADKVARAQALLAQAERHVVDLRDDGWTIKHPLSCRPNLFDCDVNTAAERDLDEPPAELGRFVCGLDGDGRLTIGPRALERGEVAP